MGVEVNVAHLGDFHEEGRCFTQVEVFVGGPCFFDFGVKLFDKGAIRGLRGALSCALILDEDEETVGEVAVFAQKLGVTAVLEISPGKLGILVFRGVCSKGIADLVGSKLGEKVCQVNGPPFGFTKLPSFEV